MDLPFYLIADTKDSYTSWSTKKTLIDKSIGGDVNVIRYEFETRDVNKIIWIPGSTNVLDPGTKPNISLSVIFKLNILTGRLKMDFEKCESKESNLLRSTWLKHINIKKVE